MDCGRDDRFARRLIDGFAEDDRRRAIERLIARFDQDADATAAAAAAAAAAVGGSCRRRSRTQGGLVSTFAAATTTCRSLIDLPRQRAVTFDP